MVSLPEGGYLRKVKDDRNAYNIFIVYFVVAVEICES